MQHLKAKNSANQPLVDHLFQLSGRDSTNSNICHALKKAAQSICLYPLVIRTKADSADLNGVGVYIGQIIGKFLEKSSAATTIASSDAVEASQLSASPLPVAEPAHQKKGTKRVVIEVRIP